MLALRSVVVAISLIFAAFLPPGISARAEAADLPLVGRYVVVGARAASDVATTLSARESDFSKALIGTELRAGDRVSWYRERCDVRPGPAEGSAALVERNLADLQIAPASSDRRLNRNLIIDCLGRAASDIWHVLVVDQRVLVARSLPFAHYLILEQPLAPGDVRLLKQRLQQAGFDPGPQDERMEETTRAAIAAFARKNGAPTLLMPGIVTVNLLNALAETASR
jgi:hypothetical protein